MNLEALGAAAARDLFTVIDGAEPRGGVRRHACDLVVRGSTGQPRPVRPERAAATG